MAKTRPASRKTAKTPPPGPTTAKTQLAGGNGRTPYASWAVALLVVIYVLLNVPLLGSKPAFFDEVKIFSVDEHKICLGIASQLRDGSLVQLGEPEVPESGCDPYPYGQLYPLLVVTPLMALQPFMPISEPMVVRWATFVLVLSGIAVLLLTYATAARLYSPWYGVLAAALLAITPEVVRWSNEIHPDLPQMAFLMAGFYFAVRLYEVAPIDARKRRLYTGLAAACAGLAMATKFNGFFLLPTIFVAYNRGVIGASPDRWRSVFLRNAVYGAGCVAVFLLVTVLCNPCHLAHPALALEPFRRSASNSMDSVRAGLSLVERLEAFVHSNQVMAESVVGYGVHILFFAAVAYALRRLWFHRDEELSSPRILAEVYAVPFLTYSLVLGYALTDGRLLAGYGRYLLPAVPMIYISVLRIVEAAANAPARYRAGAIGAVALILCIGQAPLFGLSVEQYRASSLRKAMGFFQVHNWVLDNVPEGSSIYTEAYIYVPSDKYRVTREYAVASKDTMGVNDYVITKTLDYDVYKNADRWYLYSKNKGMVESRAIYQLLEQGQFPNFERVALLSAGNAFERNDAVAVYKNLARQPAPPR